jgi:DNA-binding MarR family transcriptional regulator
MDDPRMKNPGIGFLLNQLGRISSQAWSARLARQGLEPREVMLFRFVALSEGLSQREVGQVIGLPDSRIVGLVDRLEERGWIERRANNRDRRTHALHVTASGRKVLNKVEAISVEHEDALTRGLDREERETVLGLLKRMIAAQGEEAQPSFAESLTQESDSPARRTKRA